VKVEKTNKSSPRSRGGGKLFFSRTREKFGGRNHHHLADRGGRELGEKKRDQALLREGIMRRNVDFGKGNGGKPRWSKKSEWRKFPESAIEK